MHIDTLVRTFAGFLVLVALALGGYWLAQRARGRRSGALGSAALICLVVAVILGTLGAGLVFIEPQEAAVVISYVSPKGYREQPLTSGLRWIIPFVEYVQRYSISSQSYTMSIVPDENANQRDDSVLARTADGQELYIDASVIYQINPEKLIDVHIKWQSRYTDELVRPQARGVIRDAVSQYSVDEAVTTMRFEMVDDMKARLSKVLEENGLQLIDIVLRNVTYSEEYAAAVEQKQIAEQQALQAAFVIQTKKNEAEQVRETAKGAADAQVTQAEGEAKAVVIQAQAAAEARLIQAEAEAKALEMIADALEDNPDLLTYQYINKLAPNITVMLVPADNPYILPLPTPY
jgi:regulator of protease activity HflC (stomatin/prohibitin superfamily)